MSETVIAPPNSAAAWELHAGLTPGCNVPIHKVYKRLEQVPEAHADMEQGNAIGKLVVLP